MPLLWQKMATRWHKRVSNTNVPLYGKQKRLYIIFGWKLYFGLLANNRPNLIRPSHWTLSAGQWDNGIGSVGWSWFYVDLQQLYFFVSISSGSTCLNSTRSSSGSYESLSASSPFCETVFAIHTNKSSTPDPSLKNLSDPNRHLGTILKVSLSIGRLNDGKSR